MATKINTDKLINVTDLDGNLTVKVNEYQGLYSTASTKAQMEGTYVYNVSGNDLVITAEGHTITVTDYFKANGSSKFNYLVGTDYNPLFEGSYGNIIADGLVDNGNETSADTLYWDGLNAKTGAEKYSNKITTTAFNDNVDLTGFQAANENLEKYITKGFNVNTGKGNDEIQGSVLNDTITGGVGENTLVVDLTENAKFGNDVYNFTKDEEFNLDFMGVGALAAPLNGQLDYQVSGKNVEVTAYGNSVAGYTQVTFTAAQLAAEGTFVYNALTDQTTIKAGTYKVATTEAFGPNVDAATTNLILDGEWDADDFVADTAKTFEMQYSTAATPSVLGTTVFVGEVDFENVGAIAGDTVVDYSNTLGTVTLTGLAAKNIAADLDLDGFGAFEYDELDVSKGKLTTTALDDDVDLSDYEITDKKNKGVAITTGQGDDVIVGTSGNDTITAGLGENTIDVSGANLLNKFGNDIVKLTKEEDLTIDVNDAQHVLTEANGNNVVSTVYQDTAVFFKGYKAVTYTEQAEVAEFTKTQTTVTAGGQAFDVKVTRNDAGAVTALGFWDGTNYTNITANEGDFFTALTAAIDDDAKEYQILAKTGENYVWVNSSADVPATHYVATKPEATIIGADASIADAMTWTYNAEAEEPGYEKTSDVYSIGGEAVAVKYHMTVGNTTLNSDDDYTLTFDPEGEYYVENKQQSSYVSNGEVPPTWSWSAFAAVDSEFVTEKRYPTGADVESYYEIVKDAAVDGNVVATITLDAKPTDAATLALAEDGLAYHIIDEAIVGSFEIQNVLKSGAASVIVDGGAGEDKDLVVDAFNTAVTVKKNKVTGTAFGDDMDYSGVAAYDTLGTGYELNAGAGNDQIVGSLGNDTITAGVGFNTITYDVTYAADKPSFGNDTVKLTKGEMTGVVFDGVQDGQITYGRSEDGKSIVATVYKLDNENNVTENVLGTITFENAIAKDVIGDDGMFWVNGTQLDALLGTAASAVVLDEHSKKFTGTYIDDYVSVKAGDTSSFDINLGNGDNTVDLTNAAATSANKVTGGVNNDIVINGKGDDTFKLGLSDVTNGITGVLAAANNYSFGDDTVTLTKGEDLLVTYTDANVGGVTAKIDGKDIVVTATKTVDETDYTSTMTFTGLAAKNIVGDEGSVTVTGIGNLENYDYEADVWATAADTTTKFTGTRLNDVVDAHLYTVAGDTTAATKGVTIDAKEGNNLITGSAYADTIKAGSGDDVVTATAGNDVYTLGASELLGENTVTYDLEANTNYDKDTFNLTKGENLVLDFDDAMAGQVEYKISGNDVKAIVSGKSVAGYTKVTFTAAQLAAAGTFVYDEATDKTTIKAGTYNIATTEAFGPNVDAATTNLILDGQWDADDFVADTAKTFEMQYSTEATPSVLGTTVFAGEVDFATVGTIVGNTVVDDATTLGEVTLKNFAKGVKGASVVDTVAGDLDNYNYEADVWATAADTTKKFTGTRLNDVIDATNYTLLGATKGVTIDAKDGDNRITGSAYADTIKAGSGDDAVVATAGNDVYTLGASEVSNTAAYDFTAGLYDTDTYNLTKNETLLLNFTQDAGQELAYYRKGNDIVVTATELESRGVEKHVLSATEAVDDGDRVFTYTKTVVEVVGAGEHQGEYQTVVTTYTYTGDAWGAGVDGQPSYSTTGTPGTTYQGYVGVEADKTVAEVAVAAENPAIDAFTAIHLFSYTDDATVYGWNGLTDTLVETPQAQVTLYRSSEAQASNVWYQDGEVIDAPADVDAFLADKYNMVDDGDESSIVLKNLAKGNTGADVKVSVNGAAAVDIFDKGIVVAATSESKNTFTTVYTEDDAIGYTEIESFDGAKDTIQLTTLDKTLAKLDAYDLDYVINPQTLTIDYDVDSVSTGHIRYTAYDENLAQVNNVENLTFKDATNTAWKFDELEVTATVNSFDLNDKQNNIAFVDGIAAGSTINDGAKNDIILGNAQAQGFHYTTGKDLYEGGMGSDNYTLDNGLTKATTLTVQETNVWDTDHWTDANNVLDLNSKVQDATLFFDVNSNGTVGRDILLLDKATYLNGTAASALLDDFAKGSVKVENYFTGAANLAKSTGNVNVHAKVADGGNSVNLAGFDDWANSVKTEVVAWLNDHQNYDSAMDVIEAGNKTDIQALMNVYNTTNYTLGA